MPKARGSVRGSRNEHEIVFYGISTCIWCKRTRKFLEDHGVDFDYAYVDLIQGQEREEILREVRRWNPATSFPTIVVDDSRCVIGYKPDEIAEVLGL
ncbi:MAG: glutaredoxin family protein [Anaerolineae bacterium]|jgi:glutaredoxin